MSSIGFILPHPFGDYVLLEELGRGGMGIVYRARQERLNREVALKVVLAGAYAHPENYRRFIEESKVIASLRHPNIVTLFDAGDHEGSPYYSMERIVGRDLGQIFEEHSLNPAAVAAVLRTVALAVQYAHEQRVIHRDLKPSNILIDESGQPHVTDFGLAKRVDEDSGLTISGRLLGTPGYWPPEQLEQGRAVGVAGDIYALGAILYAGLTARPPFQADSFEALLLQIVSNEPIPPRRLNPDIPRDLETICLKCLEKKPLLRYATAGELAEDLERFLACKPIEARPAGPLLKLSKWAARKPALASTLTLLTLTLAVGFCVSLTQWQRAETNAKNLLTTVTRLKLDQAEARLSNGSTSEGLAMLAMILRDDPDNRIAAQRIVSVLSSRPFLKPLPWRTSHQAFRWASAFALRGERMMASTNGGRTLTLWNVAGSPALERSIEVGASVRRSAFSRDGRRLLVATQDGRLFLYAVDSGKMLAGPIKLKGFAEQLEFAPGNTQVVVVTVPDFKTDDYRRMRGTIIDLESGGRPHEDVRFHGVAFSPDERYVATLDTKTAVIRDAQSWQAITPVIQENARINMAVFSADSTRLLTAGADNNATIWDVATGRQLLRLPHPVNVQEAFFSSDMAVAFTMDAGGQCRFWRLSDGEMIGEPFPGVKGFSVDSFSPGGTRFVSHGKGGLRVYDPRTGMPLGEPFNPDEFITHANFLPDGRRFVTTSFNNIVQLWNVEDSIRSSMVFRDELELAFASFSPDGSRIATGIKGSWARIWNVETGERWGEWLEHRSSVLRVRWSPDGRFVLTASRDHTARLWDAATGEAFGEVMRHEGPIQDAAFSSDGKWVATASEDGSARLWNARDGRPTSDPLRHDNLVMGVRFSPDGLRLASYSRDASVKFWSVPEGEALGAPLRVERPVEGLDFSPDGRLFAFHGEDAFAQIWSVRDRQPVAPPIQHANLINSVRFSPDGTTLVTASSDNTARVWRVLDGNPVSRPLRHAAEVLWAGFSPDGRFVLTTSADGTARLWDAATGHAVSDPMIHENRVVMGEWSKDGRKILTASFDRTARVWPFVAVPDEPAPSWLADLAEAYGGLRLLGNDVYQTLPLETVIDIHAHLASREESGPWREIRNVWVP